MSPVTHLTITFFQKSQEFGRHFPLFYCSSMSAGRETVHLLSSFSPLTFWLFCLFSFLNIHLSSSSAVIMQQVTSHIPWVNQIFSDLAGFFGYFSRSPKRTSMLDRVDAHRRPRASTVRWNFHIHAVNTVFEHKGDIIQCFETIGGSWAYHCVGGWRVCEAAGGWYLQLLPETILAYSICGRSWQKVIKSLLIRQLFLKLLNNTSCSCFWFKTGSVAYFHTGQV